MFSFSVAENSFQAFPSGALLEEKTATLVVSDLHLGKGLSFAREGNLLPPYDSRATLATLEQDLVAIRPQRVLLLGDSFHDSASVERLDTSELAQLQQLAVGTEWIWVTGNHDEVALGGLHALPGEVVRQWNSNGIHYTHQPEAISSATGIHVFGHYHPKIRAKIRGRYLTGKCFLVTAQCILCPAYGAFTGGLYWPEAPLRDLCPTPRILFCRKRKVIQVPLG